MSPAQFEEGLWRVGLGAINRVGMRLSKSCEADLRALIRAGTTRALSTRQGNEAMTEGQFVDATHNLLLFVGGMVAVAKRERLSELQEFTLAESKLFFCPLWPFC